MTMHEKWNARLSEYLDDELNDRERAEVEAHLTACEPCRADLAGLRAVAARARVLPDDPPAADLWPGIAARLGARTLDVEPRKAPRRFAFTLPQLVAASLALMVLSGGMVWLARLGGDRTDFPPVSAVVDELAVRPANFADGAYDFEAFRRAGFDDDQRLCGGGPEGFDGGGAVGWR